MNFPREEENWLKFRAKVSAKSIALIEKNVKLNFEQFYSSVIKTAEKLRLQDFASGERVAVQVENNLLFPILIFSLWEINAVPVLLNSRWTKSERESAIEYCGCKKILDTDIVVRNSGELDSNEKGREFYTPNETAVIIFTSGTSSKPKGVEIAFSNLYNNALLFKKFFSAKANEIWLASLPFYHIGGFAIITRAVLTGQKIIFPEKLKTESLLKVLSKQKVDYVSFVPAQLSGLNKEEIELLKKTKALLIGGGPSPENLITKLLEANVPAVKVYGSTETTSFVTAIKGEDLKRFPYASGKPIGEVKIKIEKSKSFSPLQNKAGEIIIKSGTVAKGYLDLPKLTKEKFQGEFYYSGDDGYLNGDGFLFVLSRREDLIITGGENVNPFEVEQAIQKIKDVKDCVVLPLPDEKWGQIVAALIVAEKPDSKKIVQMLRANLAGYKVPKKIVFTDSIPRNALGKTDRQKAIRLLEELS